MNDEVERMFNVQCSILNGKSDVLGNQHLYFYLPFVAIFDLLFHSFPVEENEIITLVRSVILFIH